MMDCLLFQLYGPMAAWGDVAVGERRRTYSHPSRSAVLGLVAAALGIPRTEHDQLTALSRAYRFACRTAGIGRLLVDYHTVQSVPASVFKKHPPQSRKDELERQPLKVNTILSQREYLTGAYAVACLWVHEETPPYTLEALAEALRAPAYTLYLGRKACPLALPLAPQVVSGVADPIEALQVRFPQEELVNPVQGRARRERVFWESSFAHRQPQQTRRRRDVATNRAGWLFTERLEHAAVLPQETADVSQSD